MDPLDPWRAAKLLIDLRGAVGAEFYAVSRIDELTETGDLAGVRVWRNVLAAMAELQRTERGMREAEH